MDLKKITPQTQEGEIRIIFLKVFRLKTSQPLLITSSSYFFVVKIATILTLIKCFRF